MISLALSGIGTGPSLCPGSGSLDRPMTTPDVESPQRHWERAWTAKAPDEVSWFEAVPATSLKLIESAGVGTDAPIIDVGGGASRLAGELHRRGHTDVTVADVSPAALEEARSQLGPEAGAIQWVEADVRDHDFGRRFDLWHDRALLHFMVDPLDRAAYVRTLERSLRRGGFALLATFGPDGPTQCSGLEVRRHAAGDLAALLGSDYEPLENRLVVHTTPTGTEQQFQYALFRRRG
jgi:SAM-dependent methyltransferase